ncbi:1-acyl-sn-glycerol-3-phosphate acyltransferase [Pedobacter antarcticus]|uniref:1-acyl-sn-glycerol-3-phosphate acyltransferase n=1 Tax=Pedobacter antarcticus TaxID=34086 RepID=A0A1I2BCZ9_9SPHI|nr:lysophospholipid acyltransferase family protein [Pedobacter antarcticus]SFE53030.1 1-acyl-sn-glycerol-3-phosphate acyltransferase [Pedobacter antarcticus]
MILLLRHLHRFYVIVVILFFFVLFYPFYWLASRKPSGYFFLNHLRTANSWCSSVFSGIYFRFHYESPLQNDQAYVFAANHSSNLDIMLFCQLAKGAYSFLGKVELLKNPVLKLFFQTIDIPLDRASKMSAFRAFKRAGEQLNAGRSLIIFPEGGISGANYPPTLEPFKNGPFRMAIETGTPIVAVSISDAWKLMWDDGAKYGTRPGICDIYVHSPIVTENMSADDAEKLKERIFELIKHKIVQK